MEAFILTRWNKLTCLKSIYLVRTNLCINVHQSFFTLKALVTMDTLNIKVSVMPVMSTAGTGM